MTDTFTITVATEQGVVVDQLTVDATDVATSTTRGYLGDRVANVVTTGLRMLEREREEAEADGH